MPVISALPDDYCLCKSGIMIVILILGMGTEAKTL